jgi:hypothetical protein
MFKRLQPENPNVSQFRQNLGTLLYKFAWLIEFCAVAVGITISVMMMMSSFNESMNASGKEFGVMAVTNIIIAGLPFIMVAITELTKIPFAQACYYTTSRLWKIIFGISLFLISFITFESAFNGFERNDASLNTVIDKLNGEINKLDESITPKQDRILELSELTIKKIEQTYNERTDAAQKTKEKKISGYDDEIALLRSSIQNQSSELISKEIDNKTTEILELRKQRDLDIKLERDRTNQSSANIKTSLDDQKRTMLIQLKSEEKKLEDLLGREQSEIVDLGLFGSKKAIIDRYTPEKQLIQSTIKELRDKILAINPLEMQRKVNQESKNEIDRIRDNAALAIKSLEGEREKLQQKLSLLIGAKENDISDSIEQYRSDKQKALEDFRIQQSQNKDDRDAQLARLKNQTQLIDKLQDDIQILKVQRVELRDEVNIKVAENQIYRFAQKWYGVKSAADLERNQVQTIANIFYGSLAALVALTGVMLAFASFVASDPTFMDREQKRNEVPKEKINIYLVTIKAFRSVRRFFVSERRRRKKIVYKENIREVIKEVPVQKVVLTEKPVDIVRKELVHVPMYTNDPTLLKTNPDFEFEQEKKSDKEKDLNN